MTTSAPVGNVSTLLNFVGSKGLTQTGGTNQTGGFESVVNKTQSSITNGSSQDQAKAPVRSGDASGVRVSDDGNRKISQTEAVSQKTASSAVTEGQKDAVEEAFIKCILLKHLYVHYAPLYTNISPDVCGKVL